MKLSQPQITVLNTLYDVATHEGGGITLANRYHSAARALIRKGLARKVERGLYRPHYFITPAGRQYWTQRFAPQSAPDIQTLAHFIPAYEQASAMTSPDGKFLSDCSTAELIDLVKERSQHAQAAAVVLLHDHCPKFQLPQYFTAAEIQRYFLHPMKN